MLDQLSQAGKISPLGYVWVVLLQPARYDSKEVYDQLPEYRYLVMQIGKK